MQKAMINRQQNAQRRSQMAPPPIQTVNQPPRSNMMAEPVNSPLTQPTPPSQRSSPSTTRSPGYPLGGMASPTADMQPRQFPQQRQMQPMPQQFGHGPHRGHNRSMSAHTVGQPYPRRSMHIPMSQAQTPYYPTSFQKHYDQLGKSTSLHPFLLLLGSFVRPRLISFVQTRNMMHKLICWTTLTAKTLIQTASYRISGCRPKPAVMQELVCKPHLQQQPPRRAMRATPCPQFLSITILCSMQIHLGLAHQCTFRILTAACQTTEGRGDLCERLFQYLYLIALDHLAGNSPKKSSDGVPDGLDCIWSQHCRYIKARGVHQTVFMVAQLVHRSISSRSFHTTMPVSEANSATSHLRSWHICKFVPKASTHTRTAFLALTTLLHNGASSSATNYIIFEARLDVVLLPRTSHCRDLYLLPIILCRL